MTKILKFHRHDMYILLQLTKNFVEMTNYSINKLSRERVKNFSLKYSDKFFFAITFFQLVPNSKFFKPSKIFTIKIYANLANYFRY